MTDYIPVPPDPWVPTATNSGTKLFPAATMDALHADAAAQILDPDSDEYAAIDTATAELAADSGTALGAALAGTFVAGQAGQKLTLIHMQSELARP